MERNVLVGMSSRFALLYFIWVSHQESLLRHLQTEDSIVGNVPQVVAQDGILRNRLPAAYLYEVLPHPERILWYTEMFLQCLQRVSVHLADLKAFLMSRPPKLALSDVAGGVSPTASLQHRAYREACTLMENMDPPCLCCPRLGAVFSRFFGKTPSSKQRLYILRGTSWHISTPTLSTSLVLYKKSWKEDVNDLLNPFNIHQWAWCELSHYDPRPQESALTSCVGSSQLRCLLLLIAKFSYLLTRLYSNRTSSATSPYADADIVYIEQRSSLQYAAFLPLGFDFLGIEAMQAFRNKAAVAFTRFSAVLAAISTSFLPVSSTSESTSSLIALTFQPAGG
ncbi:hypothetical protein J6590_047461 [Homalodisca vitripennis]|nr:hypothetical protein J6590_047460 [Homalodisca vitripennis]KAG8243329.1 hypothetical protein J6590_047461 [Homalodisca vitripennis]